MANEWLSMRKSREIQATSYRLQHMQPGIGWSREMEPSLASALAAAVENAVMDPELVDALRRSM